MNVAARAAAEAEPDAVVVTGAMWPSLSRACQGRALGLVDLGQGKDGVGSLSGTQVAALPSTRFV